MLKFRMIENKTRIKKHILNRPNNTITTDHPIKINSSLQNQKKQNQEKMLFTSVIHQPSKKIIFNIKKRQRVCEVQPVDNFNRQMAKRTIKRIKIFTPEQNETLYEQQMNCLKNYVKDLTTKCNNIKKTQAKSSKNIVEYYTNEQRKKFLMGQISFSQIDQDRVLAQKKYLSKFDHLSKSLPKMAQFNQELQQPKKNEQKVYGCLHLIDKIYIAIDELEKVGYPQKNNRFVLQYCVNGKMWLKKIFLYESDEKKDAFSMKIKYYVVGSCQQAKLKFSQFLSRAPYHDINIVREDIEGLYQHLQHCLTQKKINQLSYVANYIEKCMKEEQGKGMCRSLRFTKTEEDKMKLTHDISMIEERFGPMREISKISRRRYDELNRTYDRLHTFI